MKSNLESFINYLKDFTGKKVNSVNTSAINSLEPKILTDKKDLERIDPYLKSLKQAIDSKRINNIAITGSYGSGKSTVLRTFQHQYPEYKYLNISLASFTGNKVEAKDRKTEDKTEFERKLEISILQQMFYHVQPSQIPDSRFKRISNLGKIKLFFLAALFIFWTLSTLTLFKFGYIEKLNPQNWSSSYSLDWITISSSLVFFITMGWFIKNIYRLCKNSKINKINIKGEIELGESADKSVFNQHLEEILYFFERTEFNAVIIEDVDRFDSVDIFTKLREINILINNSASIKRPVKFVYVIKDEMFLDKSERVKFFEYIIPIIPFINPSNASDQLAKLIADAKLENVFSSEFISDVITFIDDIDMRLLINIFNEYRIYKAALSDSELKQDNLFAIITYKNLYPEDFGNLSKNKGDLYKFFFEKKTYTKSIINKCKKRIQEIDQEIKVLKDENSLSINELRTAYIYTILSKLEKFHSFLNGNEEVSLKNAVLDKHFNAIKSSSSLHYKQYSANHYQVWSTPTSINLQFKDIEKEVSSNLTYDQREKTLTSKANNLEKNLITERGELTSKISLIEDMNVKEIFELIDIDEHLGVFKGSNLMRNLLLNGHIDEHYNDYISLFHGVNLTKEDFSFERSVKSGHTHPFDFALTKVENLAKNIPDKYFKKKEILNYDLLTFLIENPSGKYKAKIDNFFCGLRLDGESQFQFIHSFINSRPKHIGFFVRELCQYKPTLWHYIYNKSGLQKDEMKKLLRSIFEHANQDDILRFNALESLEKFIAQMDDFFEVFASLQKTSTLQFFIKEKKILFETLDLPNKSQDQFFKFIYNENLYQLNQSNISVILKWYDKAFDENELKTSHYTALLKSGLKNLLKYVDDNIEDYIENVMLLIADNTQEAEKTIVDLMNRDDIEANLKTALIRSQGNKISSIDAINDLEVKQIILKNSKFAVSWINILDYYFDCCDTTETEDFDEILITILNEKENYELLSKQKIEDKDREGSEIEEISKKLIHCKELEITAYEHLLSSLPNRWKFLSFEELDDKKIEALISKKILTLNTESFNGLKAKNKNFHIQLIEVRQDSFTSLIKELSLDHKDWIQIFKSSIITLSNKLSFLEKMEGDLIINHIEVAEVVFNILPTDYAPLSFAVLQAMFKVQNSSLTKKIPLLNRNFKSLKDSEIQILIEELGGNYPKIFGKQNKPIFPINSQNNTLFTNLTERGLILRFQKDPEKDGIRVIAKYQIDKS